MAESEALAQITRAQLAQLEAAVAQLPGAVWGDSALCPLTHHFAEGVYVREMRLTQGTVLVGKVHRYQHINMLLQGELVLVSAGGTREHLIAPLVRLSPAGSQRAMLALQDSVFLTVHANPDNLRDLAALEAMIIVPSYAALVAEQEAQEEESP